MATTHSNQNNSNEDNAARSATKPESGSTASRRDDSAGALVRSAIGSGVTEAIEGSAMRLLEGTAMKVIDSLEERTVQMLTGVEDRLSGMEQRASAAVTNFEESAVYTIEHLDEVPAKVNKALQNNTVLAVGVGLGVGIAARLLQNMVSGDVVRQYARDTGQLLVKSGTTWAMQRYLKV